MIYRYHMPDYTLRRLGLFPSGKCSGAIFPDIKIGEVPGTFVCYGRKVVMEDAAQKVKVYEYPSVPDEMYTDAVCERKTMENFSFPDIFYLTSYPIVTQKVRDIIEGLDDFRHQFTPVSIFNKKGVKLGDTEYCYIHIRRRLEIENGAGARIDFNSIDRSPLATIQQNPDVRAFVESFPIWQFVQGGHDFYFNQKLFEIFKATHVTGIREYSKNGGKGAETLGHV